MKIKWSVCKINKIIMEYTRKKIVYVFLFCSGVGGFFGFLATLIYLFGGASLSGMPLIPVFCAAVAGTAGIVASTLDEFLLKVGFRSFTRQVLSFISAVLIAISYFLLLGPRFYPSILLFQNQIVGLTILGCLFGIVASLVEYNYHKLGKEVKDLTSQNKLLIELTEKSRLLEEAVRNLAVTEERNRMARELHDSVSQGIHGIIYICHSLCRHIQQEGVSGEVPILLEHLLQTAEATLSELRTMILELKPSPLQERGLPETIRRHCMLFSERQRIPVTVKLRYLCGLSPAQEIAVYRIVQESLANIEKHAAAHQVMISMTGAAEKVELIIRDDGCGFEPGSVPRGHGLENMVARAQESGGRLVIDSVKGQGSTVKVEFPCSRSFLRDKTSPAHITE